MAGRRPHSTFPAWPRHGLRPSPWEAPLAHPCLPLAAATFLFLCFCVSTHSSRILWMKLWMKLCPPNSYVEPQHGSVWRWAEEVMRVDEVPEMGSAPLQAEALGPQLQLCACPSCENTAGMGLPSGREEGSPRTRPPSLGLDLVASLQM